MIATTRAALLRGETSDDLGDEIDAAIVYAEYTDWMLARTNLVSNPKAAFDTSGFMQLNATPTREVGTLGAFGTYMRFVLNLASARVAYAVGLGMPAAGETCSVLATIRCSEAITVAASFRPNVNSGASASTIAPVLVLPAGESTLALTGPTFTAPATSNSGLALTRTAGTVGASIEITGLDIELGGAIPSYLDGDLADTGVARHDWLAVPNASPSTLETRSLIRSYHDFPISIIEKSRNEFDEASNAWRTVRYFAGRVLSTVPVEAGDRIRDNRDGSLYIVNDVERMARGLSGRRSVTLTMKRTAS